MIKFSKEHVWIKAEGDIGICGISEYAQKQLKDIVFVELPVKGKKLEQGKMAATIESVKSVSDVMSPASGEVTGVNENLKEDPTLINKDAMNKGWIFKVKISNKKELDKLMTEQEYRKFVG
jgi:glycine cleavage system H protein